jgi:hypothetical protein
MHTVGSYEAKTHLPQLLERSEHGETIVFLSSPHQVRHEQTVSKLSWMTWSIELT